MKESDIFVGLYCLNSSSKKVIVLEKVGDKWLVTHEGAPIYEAIMKNASLYVGLLRMSMEESIKSSTLEYIAIKERGQDEKTE